MTPQKPTVPLKPFLISKDEDGLTRLTVRETRHNSQGYPLVTATMLEQSFKTAGAARTFASQEYGAKTGEFASK